MSSLSTVVMKEPLIDCCEGNMVNSTSYKIVDLDLVRMKKEDVNFATQYELQFKRSDKVHALVAWFDCLFSDLKNPVTLSTSPFKEYTHWK